MVIWYFTNFRILKRIKKLSGCIIKPQTHHKNQKNALIFLFGYLSIEVFTPASCVKGKCDGQICKSVVLSGGLDRWRKFYRAPEAEKIEQVFESASVKFICPLRLSRHPNATGCIIIIIRADITFLQNSLVGNLASLSSSPQETDTTWRCLLPAEPNPQPEYSCPATALLKQLQAPPHSLANPLLEHIPHWQPLLAPHKVRWNLAQNIWSSVSLKGGGNHGNATIITTTPQGRWTV